MPTHIDIELAQTSYRTPRDSGQNHCAEGGCANCARSFWSMSASGFYDSNPSRISQLSDVLKTELPAAVAASFIRELPDSASPRNWSVMPRTVEAIPFRQTPPVRLELAIAASKIKSIADATPLIHALLKHRDDATDPAIPLILWLAYERHLLANATKELEFLRIHAVGNPLITDQILPRDAAARRHGRSGRSEFVCRFCRGHERRRPGRALEGLAVAFQGRQVDAPAAWTELRAETRSRSGDESACAEIGGEFSRSEGRRACPGRDP